VEPSPALSLVGKAPQTMEGRKLGVLVTDGVDGALLASVRRAAKDAGATVELIAPTRAGVTDADGEELAVDHALAGGPSVLFDAVVVAPAAEGVEALLGEAAAIDWIRDAFGHQKTIGFAPVARPLFETASVDVEADEGLVEMAGRGFQAKRLLEVAAQGRIWSREPAVRGPG
jgi:catalase